VRRPLGPPFWRALLSAAGGVNMGGKNPTPKEKKKPKKAKAPKTPKA
jgi:hypothetical protein